MLKFLWKLSVAINTGDTPIGRRGRGGKRATNKEEERQRWGTEISRKDGDAKLFSHMISRQHLENLVLNLPTHALYMWKIEQDDGKSPCRMQFIRRNHIGLQEAGNDAKTSVVIVEFCWQHAKNGRQETCSSLITIPGFCWHCYTFWNDWQPDKRVGSNKRVEEIYERQNTSKNPQNYLLCLHISYSGHFITLIKGVDNYWMWRYALHLMWFAPIGKHRNPVDGPTLR